MNIITKQNKDELGEYAAKQGAVLINKAIEESGCASIILATGASQFEMLDHLVKQEVDWSKVTCFHLDEYIGLTESHPASFRKYLKERFYSKVNVKEFHFINGEYDPEVECNRLNNLISDHNICVAFIGIGENGHLAFNDPPADFDTEQPYIIVRLDDDCRAQQFNEGWFPDLESVPYRAISMSIKQILKSQSIICTVPDKRKAKAVLNTVKGDVTNLVPASILKKHKETVLILDKMSASLL